MWSRPVPQQYSWMRLSTRPSGARRVTVIRLFLIKLLLVITLPAFTASAQAVSMQSVADLRHEAGILRAKNLVLVLEFASDDCAYCRKLEALFLLPMQRNADYDDKILIRSISMSDYDSVIDFDGRSLTTSEFAARYRVTVTPTLLFLSADGIELSERLVGIWSEDFFGGFIDDRIETALGKL
jgi:thioredoxin-related protein